jgi:hypothetical protein
VYSRADLSRTVTIAVAPFRTAIPTAVAARNFRVAIGFNRTKVE